MYTHIHMYIGESSILEGSVKDTRGGSQGCQRYESRIPEGIDKDTAGAVLTTIWFTSISISIDTNIYTSIYVCLYTYISTSIYLYIVP